MEESVLAGSAPTLNVDFQNADVDGRVRLTTRACLEDIAVLPGGLKEGMEVRLVDAELSATGLVTWGDTEGIWVAVVDWDAIRRD
jgi:hypothetical protein